MVGLQVNDWLKELQEKEAAVVVDESSNGEKKESEVQVAANGSEKEWT